MFVSRSWNGYNIDIAGRQGWFIRCGKKTGRAAGAVDFVYDDAFELALMHFQCTVAAGGNFCYPALVDIKAGNAVFFGSGNRQRQAHITESDYGYF